MNVVDENTGLCQVRICPRAGCGKITLAGRLGHRLANHINRMHRIPRHYKEQGFSASTLARQASEGTAILEVTTLRRGQKRHAFSDFQGDCIAVEWLEDLSKEEKRCKRRKGKKQGDTVDVASTVTQTVGQYSPFPRRMRTEEITV
jgi:hypothetical protein